MSTIFIGSIVGLIMGLTGAGGALISIPLFLGLMNVSLKEATVLSLIAVILGSLINLLGFKSFSDKKMVLVFVVFGALANYLTLPLKENLPNFMIALILSAIALFSVWSLWKKESLTPHHSHKNHWIKTIGTGLFLGLITTLTGLGGGVLLIPILMSWFGKSYEEALPVSLGTILFISLSSFLMQKKMALELISPLEIGFLALGTFMAFFALKFILNRTNPVGLLFLRKFLFTLVTIYSITSVLLKSF
jgi:uncharacterized membrane protein YfcA